MSARKRNFTTFNLSFLDIMSCGFGAIVLLFLIIDHAGEIQFNKQNKDILAEISLLEEEVKEGKENLVRVRNTIDTVDQQMAEADGSARRIIEQTAQTKKELAELDKDAIARIDHINKLQSDLEQLEKDNLRLAAEGDEGAGDNVREFVGEGDRQYLTGLKLGGKRLLILLDSSASMMDESIVNIIRLRNMSDEKRRQAAKWERAVATVEWLLAQLPKDSEFQLYSFNSDVTPAIEDSLGQWQPVTGGEKLNLAARELRKIVPQNGTNLENVFREVSQLTPRPDNIYLLTDGLPTLGSRGRKSGKVSGQDRLKLYNDALQQLPSGIPVNIILGPLEGDHMAASAYWRLAQATRGAFLSPSKDWP